MEYIPMEEMKHKHMDKIDYIRMFEEGKDVYVCLRCHTRIASFKPPLRCGCGCDIFYKDGS